MQKFVKKGNYEDDKESSVKPIWNITAKMFPKNNFEEFGIEVCGGYHFKDARMTRACSTSYFPKQFKVSQKD